MKKYFYIGVLVVLMISGMKTGAVAQDQVLISIHMFKDVSSKGETYGIRFDLSDDALKKVTRVYIKGPRGARIWVNNTLNLNDMVLSAVNLTLDEFNRWFPEGKYVITLTPAAFGNLTVQMTHNFPSTPAVLYPLDGSKDVPTNPVITWTPVTGIIGLQLQLKDDVGFVYSTGLPINATSFAVPANVLKPNTRYELALQAKVTDLSGNGLITTMIISFTTVVQ
jgi:hypothetical protein